MSHIAQGRLYTPGTGIHQFNLFQSSGLYLDAGGYMQYRVNTHNKHLQPLSVLSQYHHQTKVIPHVI